MKLNGKAPKRFWKWRSKEKKKLPFIQQIFIKHCKEPGTGDAD